MEGMDLNSADPNRLVELARAVGGINPQLGITLMTKAAELNAKRPQAAYDIKETDKGYAYFPKEPGSAPIMTGHRGPERKWEVQGAGGSQPKPPIGYRVSADGQSLEAIPGGPADKPKVAQKAPAGYRFTETGDQEIIPGGPADVKSQINIAKDTAIRDTTAAELDRLAAAAQEIMDHPGLKGITGVSGKIPNFPGSEAANAEAKLNTLKSQTAFSVLQTMRNNSKTGGALGNVSDKEGELLQNNLAALDKAQSYEAYKASLQKIIDYASSGKARINSAYGMQYGNEKKAVSVGVRNANDFLNKFAPGE
jgi:hypothetical protein